jgi:outer membrane protein assembly factor BamB
MHSLVTLLAAAAIGQAEAPVHAWRLVAERLQNDEFIPLAGPHRAAALGPRTFEKTKPHALIQVADKKFPPGIPVLTTWSKADLPTKAITVEAWVRIDKTQEWGGIAGAFQDNGPYEKGWLLGYSHRQFFFAVAGVQGNKRLEYLKARTLFQLGQWYHVAGTYDGNEQRLYVNGKLAGVAHMQKGDIEYPKSASYYLGGYRDDDENFPLIGRLESVAVFAQALSAARTAERFRERKDHFPDMDAAPLEVADWPTYQRDNLRTGVTSSELSVPLHLQWVHQTRLPPAPAWPEEAKNDYWHNKYDMEERVVYDRAFHLVGVGERIFFSSSADDRVRCLDLSSGQERWAFATEGPVRCAPTVVGERLVFGSDDGHVYCLKAENGSLVWKNRLAPEDRRIPGNSRMINAWPVRTDVLVEENKGHVCVGVFPSQGVWQCALDLDTGNVLNKKPLAVTPQGYQHRLFGKLMVPTGRNPAGAFVADLKEKGREIDREASSLSKDYPYGFAGAGSLRFAGGDGKIAAFNAEDGSKVWTASVDGKAYSFAVVGNKLLVGTHTGRIYCFASSKAPEVAKIIAAAPTPPITKFAPQIAALKKAAGVDQGYVLQLGGEIELALALAQASRFQVILRQPDVKRIDAQRATIEAAGLAHRVFVDAGGFDPLPYGDHVFNLVVPGLAAVKRDECMRVARPQGGVVFFSEHEIVRQGKLDGEGEWTHQYGDPGNTACSNDRRLQGELELQWFGKPGPQGQIDRHHRGSAPLYKAGRMFVPGEDRITAVDAYNGTILWEREFPDSRRVVVYRDSSFVALDADRLYVAQKTQLQTIDPQTGATLKTIPVPKGPKGEAKEWGYVAAVEGTLVGSATRPGSSRRTQSKIVDTTETYYDHVPLVCSEGIFGIDPVDGTTRWTYWSQRGWIPTPAIACGDGAVYFVEAGVASPSDGVCRARLTDLFKKPADLVALDLKTGKERFRKSIDLSALQHVVFVTFAQDRVIVSGSRNSTPRKVDGKVFYDLLVFDAKNGAKQWDVTQNRELEVGGDHGEQDQHPVVVGNKLFQEPFAYDLETGSRIDWKWPWAPGKRRAGCGTLTASASQFFFRDDNVALFDLEKGEARKVTTETRPGCWVNLLPVGGMLLAPEASSGCSCNFSVQTSLALTPKKPRP